MGRPQYAANAEACLLCQHGDAYDDTFCPETPSGSHLAEYEVTC